MQHYTDQQLFAQVDALMEVAALVTDFEIWRYDGPSSGVDDFLGLLRVSDSAIYVCGNRWGGGGTMEATLHRLELAAGS